MQSVMEEYDCTSIDVRVPERDGDGKRHGIVRRTWGTTRGLCLDSSADKLLIKWPKLN